ncbi:hypothetical protein F5Y16DRAFT_378860 [Xylariaceae sp. FL0255]|nr:hypothetical protein F5Y16DRAFT_378860 [Xylariaceae sp. FL0255]
MAETFAKIKRRGTDLLQNAPSLPQVQLPAMPNVQLPSMSSVGSGLLSNTLKGTWQPIDLPPLPRSAHSLDIVASNAYIFGGEADDDDQTGAPAKNDMHVVVLPWGDIGNSADYYAVPAKPSPKTQGDKSAPPPITIAEPETSAGEDKGKGKAFEGSDQLVPEARSGHATAVIGSRIFLFGGRSGSRTLEENGRVWVFETKTATWTFLDPYNSPSTPSTTFPAGRSGHIAVASDQPRDFAKTMKPVRRTTTWKEWAEGDSGEVGIPQRPITGHVAERATDDEDAGYGTFFVHGGNIIAGNGGTTRRSSDVWAFDVHARTWTQLPDAPGPSRAGASLAMVKTRLYRFGGSDTDRVLGGQLDVLELQLDDQTIFGEVGVKSRGGWESILAPPSSSPASSAADYPAPRTASAMSLVKAGGGWEYLVLQMGQSSPSPSLPPSASSPSCHNDIWAFQVPPEVGSAASVADAFWTTLGRKKGGEFAGTWTRVVPGPFDPDLDWLGGPAPRGLFAAAPMGDLEENAIFVLGGVDEAGRRLGDAWIFRLG